MVVHTTPTVSVNGRLTVTTPAQQRLLSSTDDAAGTAVRFGRQR
jgi:hypothetical protein